MHQTQEHHGNGHVVSGGISSQQGATQARWVLLHPVDELLHHLLPLQLVTQNTRISLVPVPDNFKLPEAKLPEAKLHETKLPEAKLHETELNKAKLHEAKPLEAKIHEAMILEAELPEAKLPEAK